MKVMAGGVPAWEAHEMPLFGTDATEAELAEDEVDRSIDSDEFTELYEEGAVVVDVRDQDEIDDSGLIENALHIPSGELADDPEAFLDELPEDEAETIAVHCAAGVRARDAADEIAELGFEEVYYLDGRITVHEDGSFSF